MLFIEALDLGSIFNLTGMQRPWLNPLLLAVSYTGSPWVLVPVAVLAFLVLTRLGRWRTGLLCAIAFLTSDVVCQAVQPLVGRPRPDVANVYPGRPNGPGFPSDEATTSVATYTLVALSLADMLKRRIGQGAIGVAATALVLGIGFSQMYLAWCYLSDVVGGWALGLSLALLFRWLDLRWKEHESQDWSPVSGPCTTA
jgi:membrane-associated phospholipid phosphatase